MRSLRNDNAFASFPSSEHARSGHQGDPRCVHRIPSTFSADLGQMVKSCLQVTPSARPSCDKILATPGLLNHLTGTLEGLDVDPEDATSNDNLLKTIRCPRNLGQITERLPAPQYAPRMKRCNSMALEDTKATRLEVTRDVKETQNSLLKAKPEHKGMVGGTPTKLQVERRVGASRVLCNLPTIEEDQVDDETIDVLSRLEKQVSKVN